MPKQINCPTCNKLFIVPDWRLKRAKNTYCSAKCAKYRISLTCDQCGKNIIKAPSAIKDHNFCSRSCSSRWHAIRGQSGNPFSQVSIKCYTCGKEFMRQPNQIKRNKHQYCSKKCFYKAHEINMGGDKNPVWRGGFDPYYGPNWKRQSYEARKRDNFTCQRCGILEDKLSKKLHVHHIKPLREFNRDFKKANAIGNLISLCPGCHTFLEWHPGQLSQLLASKIPKI